MRLPSVACNTMTLADAVLTLNVLLLSNVISLDTTRQRATALHAGGRRLVTATSRRALERVRRMALAFPEATERPSHGMPTFFAHDKKTFAMFADHHHGDARTALWFAAPPGAQEALVATERYFRPPYVGYRGWVGVALDARTDWKELRDLLRDAYLHVAPRKLGALLER